MTQNDGRAGFTIVELVMVMLIVGIMASIVVPMIRPERFQLDSAVIEVASSFTSQQRNAVLRQHNTVVGVDTVERHLRVHYDLDNDGEIGTAEQWFVIELGDGVTFGRGGAPARPMSNLSVSMAKVQGSLPVITYRRNGSASEEAIIYLTSPRGALSGSYPEDSRAVEIARATGRVTCYSYASGAWEQAC